MLPRCNCLSSPAGHLTDGHKIVTMLLHLRDSCSVFITVLLVSAFIISVMSENVDNKSFQQRNKLAATFSSSKVNKTQLTRAKIKKDRDKKVRLFNETNKNVFMTVPESLADSTEHATRWNNLQENGSLFQNKNGVYVSNNKSDGSDKVLQNIKSGKGSNDGAIVSKQHMDNTRGAVTADNEMSGARDDKAGGLSLANFSPSHKWLIPQLIMLGFSPVILANLKVMVMNALMLNNMALSSALFMTLKNILFGPIGGSPNVKYPNYGYRNRRRNSQSRKYFVIR